VTRLHSCRLTTCKFSPAESAGDNPAGVHASQLHARLPDYAACRVRRWSGRCFRWAQVAGDWSGFKRQQLAICLSRDRWDPVSSERCLHSRSRLPVLRDHRAEVQHPEDKSSIFHVLQDQQLCRERDLSVCTAYSNPGPRFRAFCACAIPVDFQACFDWDRADIMPGDCEIVGNRERLQIRRPGTPGGEGYTDSSGSSCHNRRLAERRADNFFFPADCRDRLMSPCSARLRFAERSHLIYSPLSGAAARLHATTAT